MRCAGNCCILVCTIPRPLHTRLKSSHRNRQIRSLHLGCMNKLIIFFVILYFNRYSVTSSTFELGKSGSKIYSMYFLCLMFSGVNREKKSSICLKGAKSKTKNKVSVAHNVCTCSYTENGFWRTVAAPVQG